MERAWGGARWRGSRAWVLLRVFCPVGWTPASYRAGEGGRTRAKGQTVRSGGPRRGANDVGTTSGATHGATRTIHRRAVWGLGRGRERRVCARRREQSAAVDSSPGSGSSATSAGAACAVAATLMATGPKTRHVAETAVANQTKSLDGRERRRLASCGQDAVRSAIRGAGTDSPVRSAFDQPKVSPPGRAAISGHKGRDDVDRAQGYSPSTSRGYLFRGRRESAVRLVDARAGEALLREIAEAPPSAPTARAAQMFVTAVAVRQGGLRAIRRGPCVAAASRGPSSRRAPLRGAPTR